MNGEEEERDTVLVPYGEGAEIGEPYREWGLPREEVREPEVVEGVFEEVREEPGVFERFRGFFRGKEPTEEEVWRYQEKKVKEEEEEKRREREQLMGRVERGREMEVQILERKRGAEIEELKAARRKYRRAYRPSIPATAKKLQRIITLGGIPKVIHKELYMPKPKAEMYVPTGMRRLTSLEDGRGALQEVTAPRLGALQRAGSPYAGVGTPIARMVVPTRPRDVGGLGPTFRRLREVSKLPLDRLEHAVLAEIRANGDRDTLQHVVSELGELGISRVEAEGAVQGLLQRGLVRETVEARGERPILEIVG